MIFMQRLLRDDSGATAIEYGLIAALIAVAAVTVLGTVGGNLTQTFQTVADKLQKRGAAPPVGGAAASQQDWHSGRPRAAELFCAAASCSTADRAG
jgi:pilus assembly protein Flp/PilA